MASGYWGKAWRNTLACGVSRRLRWFGGWYVQEHIHHEKAHGVGRRRSRLGFGLDYGRLIGGKRRVKEVNRAPWVHCRLHWDDQSGRKAGSKFSIWYGCEHSISRIYMQRTELMQGPETAWGGTSEVKCNELARNFEQLGWRTDLQCTLFWQYYSFRDSRKSFDFWNIN